MFYVYVLQSLRDQKMYIGYSADLRKRIQYHYSGNVKSTKGRRPLRLIFYEAFENQEDARRRENYFKTNPGKKSLRLILRKSFINIVPTS